MRSAFSFMNANTGCSKDTAVTVFDMFLPDLNFQAQNSWVFVRYLNASLRVLGITGNAIQSYMYISKSQNNRTYFSRLQN